MVTVMKATEGQHLEGLTVSQNWQLVSWICQPQVGCCIMSLCFPPPG